MHECESCSDYPSCAYIEVLDAQDAKLRRQEAELDALIAEVKRMLGELRDSTNHSHR
jgi:hypothetical protein